MGGPMQPDEQYRNQLARRAFLGRSATGVGSMALASLLAAENARGETSSLSSPFAAQPGLPHFPSKAKRVIWLFQNGAPTHVDLFDYKPKLRELHGQPLPAGYAEGRRFSTMTGAADGKLMLAPVEPFRQRGESGSWVSDFLPHTAAIADRLCFVKSMHTEAVNHAPAIQFLLSGAELPGRPTAGAWLTWGLGSETQSLPAFVVMTSQYDLRTDLLRLLLGQWFSAVEVSGSQVQGQWRSGALSEQSGGHVSGDEAWLAG